MLDLDPNAVQAFVLIAELRSFTRAAEVLNTTQAAVSLKLRRLEERLGQRLIERTPRQVRLSEAGAIFLDAARDIVTAHERATTTFQGRRIRLRIAITHHIVGPDLPILLKRINAAGDGIVVDMRIGGTRDLLKLYDDGALDAVIALDHDATRRDGEVILAEQFLWMSAPAFERPPGQPLPLATQAAPCSLRAMALERLDAAGIAWAEVFVGGGAATIGAAAAAGLAVAALSRRAAPPGVVDVGQALGLPPLPSRNIVLHSSITAPRAGAVLRSLVAAFRA